MQKILKCIEFSWLLILILLPLFLYYDLRSTFYDFGLYINYALTYDLGNIIAFGHFNLYQIPMHFIGTQFNNAFLPYIMLLLQSSVLVLVFFIIKKNCSSKISTAYIFSYPIIALDINDFHYEFLCVLFITLYFVFLSKGNLKLSTVFATLVSFSKEVYSPLAVLMIIYAYIENRKFSKKDVFSCFLSILIPSLVFVLYFTLKYNGSPLVDIDSTDTTAWLFHLGLPFNFENYWVEFISLQKIITIFLPIILFGILPIFSPRILIAIPILFILIFSPHYSHSSLNSHYSSILIPIYAFSASHALDNSSINTLQKRIFDILVPSVSILSSFVFIAMLVNYNWRFSVPNNLSIHRNNIIKDEITNYFQSRSQVLVCTQNNLVYYPMLTGVVYPFPMCDKANVVFIDAGKELFLNDQRCGDNKSTCNTIDFMRHIKNLLANNYAVSYQYDSFYILERK